MPEHMDQKDDGNVWMPLQTIYNKEMHVAGFLQEKNIEHYIPMGAS